MPLMLTLAILSLTASVDAFPFPAPAALLVAEERPPAERPRPTFTFGLLHEFRTDLGSASVGVTRADIGIQAPIPPLAGWRISADLASEWSWYDFDDFDAVAGGSAPLAHAHSSLLGLTLVRPFGEGWSFVARPVVAASGDQDADFGDSVLFGGFVTIGRQMSETLRLSVGVYAAEQFEDDAVVFPIAGIEWQIDEATKLSTPGPGLRLTRDLAPGWQAYLQGIYRPRDYRLADDSSVPGGALSDDSVPVTLGALWSPNQRVQLSLLAGALVFRNIEVRDDGGDVVFDEDADTSVFAGIGLRIGL